MKVLFTTIIFFIGNGLFAQNEMPNREKTKVKLAFEQEIENSPYFVEPKALQLYPGEKVFIEIEKNANSITSMHVVKENLNPDKTIEVSFRQEISNVNGNAMFLNITNPFNQPLLVESYIQLLIDGSWTKTTILPIQANSSGIEVWYDAILSIGLHNWKFKEDSNVASKTKNTDDTLDENISKEKTYNWLKRNDIQLNKLHLASQEEIVYTCDSSLYLKHVKGDTITYWTYGWRSHIDTTQALDWIKNPEYGKTSYLKKVNWNGTLTRVSLIPRTFRINNDSIFELQQFYTVSNDSLSFLLDHAFSIEEDDESEFYKNIIDVNTFQKFKLIYHPSVFIDNVYEGNFYNDRITLVDNWECEGKNYFAIEISNYRINGEETKYTLMFDNEFRCMEYENCNPIAEECLKNRNFEIHYR